MASFPVFPNPLPITTASSSSPLHMAATDKEQQLDAAANTKHAATAPKGNEHSNVGHHSSLSNVGGKAPKDFHVDHEAGLRVDGRSSPQRHLSSSTTKESTLSPQNVTFEAQKPKGYSTFDASSLLAVDPSCINIDTVPPSEEEFGPPTEEALKRLPFVSMFRGSANYIANHRNTLAVYHIPGGLLDQPGNNVFRDLMNDIALTWLLGMKIVLVVGCRHQIAKRVAQHQSDSSLEENLQSRHGLRVTDEKTLRIVKEEAGYVRFEVERQLARSLRMQGGGMGNAPGVGSTGQGYYDGNVVSGNFYSAQPFGILDGVDFK